MNSESRLAAQYLRMSTDRQDLSPLVQKEAIAKFAEKNNLVIVRSFEDEGKSGVRIINRPGLRGLLREVETKCEFSTVLVYDVSRWGRFQDVDAGAYYEYHCRLHGVEVVYVAEPFGSDHAPMNMLAKSVKRVMAAEYSRELAAKSRAGQMRVLAMGFQMGPLPQFGYRRVSVSADRSKRVPLERGELKRTFTDRIEWVLGPSEEVQLVRTICAAYAFTDMTLPDIAAVVRSGGWRTVHDGPVTCECLLALLRNEALIGNLVWGTGSAKGRIIESAPVRQNGTVPRIIDDATWSAIQRRLQTRPQSIFYRPRRAPRSTPATSVAEKGERPSSTKRVVHSVQTKELGKALCAELNKLGVHAGYEGLSNTLSLWGVLVRIRLSWQGEDGHWSLQKRPAKRAVDYVLVVRMQAPYQPLDFFLVTSKFFYKSFPKKCGLRVPSQIRRFRHIKPENLGACFALLSARAEAKLRGRLMSHTRIAPSRTPG